MTFYFLYCTDDEVVAEEVTILDENLNLEPGDHELPANQNAIIKWFTLMFLWWQARFNITNVGASFILMIVGGLLTLIVHPLRLVFPRTLYQAHKYFPNQLQSNPIMMVVCPSDICNEIYELSEAYTERDGQKVANKCTGKMFNKNCAETLVYTKSLSHNKTTLMPYKQYPFKPPSQWLREMVQLREFRQLLESHFHHE